MCGVVCYVSVCVKELSCFGVSCLWCGIIGTVRKNDIKKKE
nr:MAG TPA: hypothetical protein [Bacteriophage sp.]